MDEKELAQQLKKTGNLMDLLNDPDWLQKSFVAEVECNGYVEAGVGLQTYVEQLKKASPENFRAQRQQMRLLSVFLPALHDWLISWGLGPSFEVVYAEAQRLVYGHLVEASAEQALWIEEALTENNPNFPIEEQRKQVWAREKLAELLQQQDWQVLARVAARDVEKRILERAQAQSATPIAV
jgi:hypothetical protein